MKRHRKLGIVFWYDAQYLNREELPHELPVMESVGYITKLKDRIIITGLVTPCGDTSLGIHTIIPLGCVKDIIYLERKDGLQKR